MQEELEEQTELSPAPPVKRMRSAWGWLAGMYLVAFLVAGLLVFLPTAPVAYGATFLVNNAGDLDDIAPGDGQCLITGGGCTLRAAISEASFLAGDDVIQFALTNNTTINVASPLLAINGGNGKITLDGPAVGTIIIKRTTTNFRLFNVITAVNSIGDLTINRLTIRESTGNDGGGAISNNGGNVTINNSTFTANRVLTTTENLSPKGGAIYTTNGNLTINNSNFTDNRTKGVGDSGEGGVIFADSGNVSINGSAFGGTGSNNTNVNFATSGGGIYNYNAIMTVTNSTFYANHASTNGGAIFNSIGENNVNSLAIINSSFITSSGVITNSFNQAARGGAIYVEGGRVKVVGSTFTGNRANAAGVGSGGGAIYAETGTTDVINSTISNNSSNGAGSYGGGILANTSSIVNISSSTIVSNTTTNGFGGGVAQAANATARLKNTLVAFNTASANLAQGPDLSGNFTDSRYNLVRLGDGNLGISNGTNGNKVGGNGGAALDPVIGLLQNNGGPTLTRALLAGSPALNAGDPAGCSDFTPLPVVIDQRGFPRPAGPACDIGAFELQSPPTLDLSGPLDATNNFAATFQEEGGPKALVSQSLLVGGEGNLTSAAVTLTTRLNSPLEVLAATTAGTAITATYDEPTGVLSLTGTDTVANYQMVLRSVTYNNTALFPTNTTRTINFTVSDGVNSSAVATTNLTVLSALVVTNGNDTGAATSFGTLSYALSKVGAAGRLANEKIVSFGAAVTDVTVTGGSALTLPPGATLNGRCGATGPEVTIKGAGRSVVGLTLGGGNTVKNIGITNFNSTLLVAGGTGNTVGLCVRAIR